MKIVIGLAGAQPIAPDYAMLRAALLATQAATPTARCCATTPAATVDPRAALHGLFAESSAHAAVATALDHRFSRAVAFGDDRS